ncbi:hypothetical protein [Meiothermus sp.]|uniref:hypothetical protein n=1 Tax=Meiothermus sp. TaxID=1955249 RepID=UPI00298F0DAB|nr:hypothetical protein [Meiothermus sp.]MCS7068779.1 hypothetical protein [Meiothermus sp.]
MKRGVLSNPNESVLSNVVNLMSQRAKHSKALQQTLLSEAGWQSLMDEWMLDSKAPVPPPKAGLATGFELRPPAALRYNAAGQAHCALREAFTL